MKWLDAGIPGAFVIRPETRGDSRGFLARVFDFDEFVAHGFGGSIVQINHSHTSMAGTVRGMHFQAPPHAEIKVVKCIQGRVFDVIVDVRRDSPTFLRWVGAELSEENMAMMYVPRGFAHGFQALSNGTELLYLHNERYAPEAERGLQVTDPSLSIQWPLAVVGLSPRDMGHPRIDAGFQGVAL